MSPLALINVLPVRAPRTGQYGVLLTCTLCGWEQAQPPGGRTLATLVLRAETHIAATHPGLKETT